VRTACQNHRQQQRENDHLSVFLHIFPPNELCINFIVLHKKSIKGKISVYIFTVTHLFIKCLQAI
jgi:hypothetical protein